jgi:hypothetical protein
MDGKSVIQFLYAPVFQNDVMFDRKVINGMMASTYSNT